MKINNLIRRPLMPVLAVIAVLLSACTNQTVPAAGDAPAESGRETAAEGSEGIHLSQSQLDAVGIKLGNLETKNLKSVVKASGQLEVPPQNRAEVTLLTGGLVKQVYVLEGQEVRKGQKLAVIENTQVIQLQQDYMTALSNLAYATKEYERQRELNEARAGTGKLFQQSQNVYRSEQARVKALQGQLRQFGIDPAASARGGVISSLPVYAPISGTVGKIAIEIGSYVEPARSLMNIVDNSKVHCDLIIYEKDLFKVKVGQQVNFILTNQNNREVTGKIYGINKSFEDESKAIVAHAVIEQGARNKLIQGMYISALINVGQQRVQAVPSDAVVKSGGKEYIYYLKRIDEDRAETAAASEASNKNAERSSKNYVFALAEVVSGVTDLGYTEVKVISSLPKDVKVVTSGAFYILSSQKTSGDEE